VAEDSTASLVVPGTGSKRKAVGVISLFAHANVDLHVELKDVTVDEAEIKSNYDSGKLAKVRLLPSGATVTF
jgi:hypothetical protein